MLYDFHYRPGYDLQWLFIIIIIIIISKRLGILWPYNMYLPIIRLAGRAYIKVYIPTC